MDKHAKFAPSAAHRWIPCPGSIRLSEGIEDKPSEYAMEGSILHTIVEQCLREKLKADEFIGQIFNIDDYELEIDGDHATAVQYCVDEVKRIMAEGKIVGGKLEVSVVLNDKCWGTVDVLLFNDEYVTIIDHKFGRGKSVGAEGNAQLMIYFLGAMKFLSENKLVEPLPKKARLIILQPRIPNPTRVWETTVDEIKTWYVKSVKPAFDMAENGDAPCNPGEEQCQFCPANGVCTSRADYLLGVAEQEFKPYIIPPEGPEMADDPVSLPALTTKNITKQLEGAVDYLTPQIAANILGYQDDFDNFFKRVGEYAMKLALRGDEVPGMKIVYGKSNRKWSMPDGKIEAMLKKLEVEPFKEKLVSPAQAEKALGTKRKKELAEYIYKPVGKKILVDESDTRETVDMSSEDDMKEFANGTIPEEQSKDVSIFEDSSSIDDIMGDVEKKPEREEEVLTGSKSTPPGKRTKKYQLMLLGLKGGVLVTDAASDLFNGNEMQVIKGLRNLHERDGYTVTFHANNSFTVKEAE